MHRLSFQIRQEVGSWFPSPEASSKEAIEGIWTELRFAMEKAEPADPYDVYSMESGGATSDREVNFYMYRGKDSYQLYQFDGEDGLELPSSPVRVYNSYAFEEEDDEKEKIDRYDKEEDEKEKYKSSSTSESEELEEHSKWIGKLTEREIKNHKFFAKQWRGKSL